MTLAKTNKNVLIVAGASTLHPAENKQRKTNIAIVTAKVHIPLATRTTSAKNKKAKRKMKLKKKRTSIRTFATLMAGAWSEI